MIKEALQFLMGLMEKPVVDIGDKVLVRDGLTYKEFRAKEDLPAPINTHTLKSIVDYLTKAVDKLPEKLILHIENECNVSLYSPLSLQANRGVYMHVSYEPPISDSDFGNYKPSDEFINKLQALFVRTDERDALIKVAGNINAGSGVDTSDDGMTQTVEIRKNLVLKERGELQNRFKLSPFRTFPEIAQPQGNFVFRVKGDDNGIKCMLIDADNDAWKLTAIRDIAGFFTQELGRTKGLLENITIVA